MPMTSLIQIELLSRCTHRPLYPASKMHENKRRWLREQDKEKIIGAESIIEVYCDFFDDGDGVRDLS